MYLLDIRDAYRYNNVVFNQIELLKSLDLQPVRQLFTMRPRFELTGIIGVSSVPRPSPVAFPDQPFL
jgi:hypothetical protein